MTAFKLLKFLFHNCVLSVSINKQSFNCYADVNVSAYPNVRKDTFVKYLDILKGWQISLNLKENYIADSPGNILFYILNITQRTQVKM